MAQASLELPPLPSDAQRLFSDSALALNSERAANQRYISPHLFRVLIGF
jgi:hypothetical protein